MEINNFSRHCKNGKYNFINEKGEYLTDQWFDEVKDFKNGFALVKIKNNVIILTLMVNILVTNGLIG